MKRHLPILVLTLLLAANCGGSKSSGGGGGDTTPPSIAGITPASASSGIARNAPLIITFNEALNESVKGKISLTTPAISFTADEITVSGTTVIVNPATDFAASTAHTGIDISGFEDLAGNTMQAHSDAGYTFTTGTDSDTTPPTVLSIMPADGATNVSPDTNIVITFSEPLSVTKGTVNITTPAKSFSAAEISISGSTVTINPATDFSISTAYSGLSISGFSDTAGNSMSAHNDSGYDFTTAADTETLPADMIPLADTEQNATMIQYFHWYLKNDGTLWTKIKDEAATLKSLGITAVWMPPAYKAYTDNTNPARTETNTTNYDHVGYAVYDTYDLGQFSRNNDGVTRTKYGTKLQYFDAISALHTNSIQAIADIVMNHRMGAEQSESVNSIEVNGSDRTSTIGSYANRTAWTRFTFPGRNGKYSTETIDFNWFDGFDAGGKIYLINGKSWDSPVSTENVNYDYLMGSDIDFDYAAAAQYYKDWAVWYVQHAKIDGFRLDAVKHIDYDFQKSFIDDVRTRIGKSDFFVVGEYWQPYGEATINAYLDSVNGTGGSYVKRIHAFDAPLNKNFYRNAGGDDSGGGAGYDLRTVVDGTLMNNNQFHAVTLVENHDTQPGQALDSTTVTINNNWIKQIAYATVLLRQQGYPCVFYADLYGCDINGDGDFDDTISGIGFMGKEAKEFPPTPKLNKLLEARKLFAYGNQRIIGTGLNGENADTPDTVAWIRGGISSKPKSGCLVMISDNGLGGSRTIKFYESSTLVDNRFKNTTFIDYLGNTSTEVTTDGNGIGTFPYPPGAQAYVWVLK